jgi:ferredoxin-NADP reductase
LYLIKFIKKDKIATDTYTFYFTKPRNYRYIGGQYSEFQLSPTSDSKRWFTLSSAPSENTLQLTTKINLKLASSFKISLWNLKEGQTIHIQDAFGDFVLPKNLNQDLLFIIAGIGLTPLLSILKESLNQQLRIKLQLVYIVKDTDYLVDLKRYQKLFKSTRIIYTSQIPFKPNLIDENLAQLQLKHKIYLSGPDKFITKLRDHLIEQSISESNIISDYFDGYLEI